MPVPCRDDCGIIVLIKAKVKSRDGCENFAFFPVKFNYSFPTYRRVRRLALWLRIEELLSPPFAGLEAILYISSDLKVVEEIMRGRSICQKVVWRKRWVRGNFFDRLTYLYGADAVHITLTNAETSWREKQK